MKKKILLDSFALLAYLKKENNYGKVKNILSSNNTSVFMNDINIGETYYILARERGMEKADFFLHAVLPILPISNIENTLQDVIEASKIKAKFPISYADCFAVASAFKEKATIITGDPEFKLVEKLLNIEWL